MGPSHSNQTRKWKGNLQNGRKHFDAIHVWQGINIQNVYKYKTDNSKVKIELKVDTSSTQTLISGVQSNGQQLTWKNYQYQYSMGKWNKN